jgi:hypothetical protein
MSTAANGKRAQIEISSPDAGVEWEARWLPISGMAYHPNNGSIEFLLDGIEQLILHPCDVYVDYGHRGLECVGIVDQDLAWQIIVLRDPLMLPAPDSLSPCL